MTDLLHLSNYTPPFIVKVKPDEVLGNLLMHTAAMASVTLCVRMKY